jgi:hypothetical protein
LDLLEPDADVDRSEHIKQPHEVVHVLWGPSEIFIQRYTLKGVHPPPPRPVALMYVVTSGSLGGVVLYSRLSGSSDFRQPVKISMVSVERCDLPPMEIGYGLIII